VHKERAVHVSITGSAGTGKELKKMNIPRKQPESRAKTREEQIAERLAQIPESQQQIYLRAVKGKNRAAAVKAFCYECCGNEREEVRLCTDLGCPLWLYRPGRKGHRISKEANGERFSAVESTN
jgi:hypothetical protein